MIITASKLRTLCSGNRVIGPFTLGLDPESFRLSVEYNGEIYTFLNNEPSVGQLNHLLHSQGLPQIPLVISAHSAFQTFVDIIYNHFVEQYFFDNGKIKQSSIHELVRRVELQDAVYVYTDTLLNNLIQLGVVLPPAIIQNIQSIDKYVGTVKSKFFFVCWTQGRIDAEYTVIPYSISLTELGYEFSEEASSWISPDAETVMYKGKKYFKRQMKTCEECGGQSPHLHSGLCEVCLKIDPALITIRNYQERAPSFIPFKIGKYSNTLYKTPLLFGIEVEYESTNKDKALLDTARLLSHHAIFKRDGSIQTGFEIVTTAATFDYHEEAFSKFFDKFPSTLKSAENTGMHIHISRAPLSMLTQGKLVEFMNREDNREFLKDIAGRVANHFTSLDPNRTISFPFLHTEAARYNTLNINNAHTLEFRIFATPTDFKTFIQRLDFVRAIVAYCSPCQSKATSLKQVTHHSEFTKYVKDHMKDFPYFYEYLFPETVSIKNSKLQAFKSKAIPTLNTGAI